MALRRGRRESELKLSCWEGGVGISQTSVDKPLSRASIGPRTIHKSKQPLMLPGPFRHSETEMNTPKI